MDLLTLFQAALLGIVEGVTEFLPISSTGHLILIQDMLGFKGPPGQVFPVVIQFGAILAVCWLYRQKLIDVLVGLPRDPAARRFTLNILLAFLPSAIIGLLAYRVIKEVLFSPVIVAVALIVGGIAILLIERLPWVNRPDAYDSVEQLPFRRALAVGFFQCLAMIPGTSRSAATIMGALLVGVSRRAAADFSFMLAIPTMLAAASYDLYKNRAAMTVDALEVIAVGFLASFIVALLVVRWVLGYVSRHGFAPFAYYRIVFGSLMLILLLAR
jgi:undecaprenyl-diphosphatase